MPKNKKGSAELKLDENVYDYDLVGILAGDADVTIDEILSAGVDSLSFACLKIAILSAENPDKLAREYIDQYNARNELKIPPDFVGVLRKVAYENNPNEAFAEYIAGNNKLSVDELMFLAKIIGADMNVVKDLRIKNASGVSDDGRRRAATMARMKLKLSAQRREKEAAAAVPVPDGKVDHEERRWSSIAFLAHDPGYRCELFIRARLEEIRSMSTEHGIPAVLLLQYVGMYFGALFIRGEHYQNPMIQAVISDIYVGSEDDTLEQYQLIPRVSSVVNMAITRQFFEVAYTHSLFLCQSAHVKNMPNDTSASKLLVIQIVSFAHQMRIAGEGIREILTMSGLMDAPDLSWLSKCLEDSKRFAKSKIDCTELNLDARAGGVLPFISGMSAIKLWCFFAMSAVIKKICDDSPGAIPCKVLINWFNHVNELLDSQDGMWRDLLSQLDSILSLGVRAEEFAGFWSRCSSNWLLAFNRVIMQINNINVLGSIGPRTKEICIARNSNPDEIARIRDIVFGKSSRYTARIDFEEAVASARAKDIGRIMKLEDENRQLREAAAKAGAEKAEAVAAAVKTLTEENAALRERIRALGGELDALQEKSDDQERELARLEASLNELAPVGAESVALKRQVGELRDKLAKSREDRTARVLENKRRAAEHEAKRKAERQALEQQVAVTQAQSGQLIQALQWQLASNAGANRGLQANIEFLRNAFATVDWAREDMAGGLSKFFYEINRLNGENKTVSLSIMSDMGAQRTRITILTKNPDGSFSSTGGPEISFPLVPVSSGDLPQPAAAVVSMQIPMPGFVGAADPMFVPTSSIEAAASAPAGELPARRRGGGYSVHFLRTASDVGRMSGVDSRSAEAAVVAAAT